MQKWLQKILIPFAFMLALGHNVFPHNHHEEISAIDHHHDDDDHEKNPFSFKYLDHIFVPSQVKIFHLDDCLVSTSQPEYNFNIAPSLSKKIISVVFKNEFPPPCHFNHTISRRGPPIS